MVQTAISLVTKGYCWCLGAVSQVSGLPLLALRVYLFPVLCQAGWRKFEHFDSQVAWFGGDLGIPFPALMVILAGLSELVGSILLLMGWFTRLIAIPLMFTMLVAAFLVHGENGWLTLSDDSSWLANERIMEAAPKKARIKSIVQRHGNIKYLESSGKITLLNNGMQFAITYFLMLFVLLCFGGGRYVSVDYWVSKGLIRWRARSDDGKQN